MSVYGSYPPSSGYDYNAPPLVVLPTAPNGVQNYQLPDVQYQTNPETMTRNFQQDLYYEDQVLVKNHVVWQPTLYRTYEYVPPKLVSQGPIREQSQNNAYPQVSNGFNQPYSPMANVANTMPSSASPQELFSQLWSGLTLLLNTLQQWAGG